MYIAKQKDFFLCRDSKRADQQRTFLQKQGFDFKVMVCTGELLIEVHNFVSTISNMLYYCNFFLALACVHF